MEGNRIAKRVLYMNLGTARLRGRPRNRWQDEVREDGRIVGGEGWQGKVHNREGWKELLRTARNGHILHMPRELMNVLPMSWLLQVLRSPVLKIHTVFLWFVTLYRLVDKYQHLQGLNLS